MYPVRACVVQAASAAFDTPRAVEKAVRLAGQAAGLGAGVVVFPEAFLGGYPKGADFGARVGMRTREGRAWFRRYFESGINIPGPETAALGDAARSHKLHMVIGAIERDGGTLYCSVLFLAPDGSLLGKHRKVMPTAMERLIWGFGDGSTLPVFDTSAGRLGAVICWENYMPLLRTAMYAQGIQVYCAPTVDDRDTWIPTMRHIAMEGRTFVLSACQFARRRDYPADYECVMGDEPETILIRGGSTIVDPLGQVLAGPVYGEECLLTADLDPGRIAEGKYDLDVAGHYARPDIFRLTVNRQLMRPVEFRENEANDTSSAQ
jgi:nitrilase